MAKYKHELDTLTAAKLTVESAAGYFEVMFTQQVASYDQDLGVTTTGPMQMNWLLRSEAYAWYFLPPVTSVLILWWYAPPCPAARNLSCFPHHCCIGGPEKCSHCKIGWSVDAFD